MILVHVSATSFVFVLSSTNVECNQSKSIFCWCLLVLLHYKKTYQNNYDMYSFLMELVGRNLEQLPFVLDYLCFLHTAWIKRKYFQALVFLLRFYSSFSIAGKYATRFWPLFFVVFELWVIVCDLIVQQLRLGRIIGTKESQPGLILIQQRLIDNRFHCITSTVRHNIFHQEVVDFGHSNRERKGKII